METVHQHDRGLPGVIALVDEAEGPVLRLSGEVDTLVVDAWQAATWADHRAAVAVDASAATFLDGRALRLLLRETEQTRRTGRVPELRGPSRTLRRLLEITGTAPLFTAVC